MMIIMIILLSLSSRTLFEYIYFCLFSLLLLNFAQISLTYIQINRNYFNLCMHHYHH